MKRDPSGYWKMIGVLKGGEGSGENEGHPFRGNQWTEGGSTAGDAPIKHPTPTERNIAQRLIAHMAGGSSDEKAYLPTPTGEVIEVAGQGDRVVFNEDVIKKAVAIIHNHPGGASFSAQDCGSLIQNPNVRSIDAVTKGGTTYRLEKPETFVMPQTQAEQENLTSKIWKEWHWKEEELRSSEYQNRFDKGEDGNMLWKEQTDRIAKYIAETFGFRYSKWDCLKGEKSVRLAVKGKHGGGTYILDDSSIAKHPYGERK